MVAVRPRIPGARALSQPAFALMLVFAATGSRRRRHVRRPTRGHGRDGHRQRWSHRRQHADESSRVRGLRSGTDTTAPPTARSGSTTDPATGSDRTETVASADRDGASADRDGAITPTRRCRRRREAVPRGRPHRGRCRPPSSRSVRHDDRPGISGSSPGRSDDRLSTSRERRACDSRFRWPVALQRPPWTTSGPRGRAGPRHSRGAPAAASLPAIRSAALCALGLRARFRARRSGVEAIRFSGFAALVEAVRFGLTAEARRPHHVSSRVGAGRFRSLPERPG